MGPQSGRSVSSLSPLSHRTARSGPRWVGPTRKAEVKLPGFSWLDSTASRYLIQGFPLRFRPVGTNEDRSRPYAPAASSALPGAGGRILTAHGPDDSD